MGDKHTHPPMLAFSASKRLLPTLFCFQNQHYVGCLNRLSSYTHQKPIHPPLCQNDPQKLNGVPQKLNGVAQ